MWYAFWIVSLLLISGVIILYAWKREHEQTALQKKKQKNDTLSQESRLSKDEKTSLKNVLSTHTPHHTRFSEDTLPSFLKDLPEGTQPTAPSRKTQKRKTPHIKGAKNTKLTTLPSKKPTNK